MNELTKDELGEVIETVAEAMGRTDSQERYETLEKVYEKLTTQERK